MNALPHPDNLSLRSAQGWLELGNPHEATLELQRIRPPLRRHPDVLEVRWQLCAQAKHWEQCVQIANAIIKAVPERATGWIHLSYALHELRLTEDAHENLLGVVNDFPEEPVFRYNLACYCCQLGHKQEAKAWLRQAMKLGDPHQIIAMALKDPDLKPLWRDLKKF